MEKKQKEEEEEREKEKKEKRDKKKKEKSILSFMRKEKDSPEEEGSFEFTLAGLFKCMLCTHPKGSEEKVHLMRIADNLDRMTRRIDNIER